MLHQIKGTQHCISLLTWTLLVHSNCHCKIQDWPLKHDFVYTIHQHYYIKNSELKLHSIVRLFRRRFVPQPGKMASFTVFVCVYFYRCGSWVPPNHSSFAFPMDARPPRPESCCSLFTMAPVLKPAESYF